MPKKEGIDTFNIKNIETANQKVNDLKVSLDSVAKSAKQANIDVNQIVKSSTNLFNNDVRNMRNEFNSSVKELDQLIKRYTNQANQGYYGSSVKSITNAGIRQTRESSQNEIQQIVTNVINEVNKRNGGINDTNREKVLQEIEEGLQANSGAIQKSSQKMELSIKAYQTANDIFKTATNAFSSAVETFGGLIKSGINSQRNAYENSFTNISVRNGTTSQQYYQAQRDTNQELKDLGLQNNVAVSSIQNMWQTLANEGIAVDLSDADTIANAIDTVVTNEIVPYLNTSDAYFQNLATHNTYLMQQVRGIGASVQETVGNNVVANKYLQDMIDSLSPIAQYSEYELGLQYASAAGTLETLRQAGMSDDAISEMYYNSKSMYSNPYDTLQNGSVSQRLAIVEALQTGADMQNYNEMLNLYLEAQRTTSGLMGEFTNSNAGTLFANIGRNALSDVSTSTFYQEMQLLDDELLKEAERNGEISAQNTDSMAEQLTENFAEDINTTNKTEQEILSENISTEFAIMAEKLGAWYDTIEKLVENVIRLLGSLLVTSVTTGIGSLVRGTTGGIGKVGNAVTTGLTGVTSTVGTNLAASGASVIGDSAALGTQMVIGGATALGGLGVAVAGANQAYNFAQEDKTGRAITSGIGATLGAAGAIAALAGTGVGAPLAIVGALAVGGAKIYDVYQEYKEATRSATDDFLDEIEEDSKKLRTNLSDYEYSIADSIHEIELATDYETAKNIAIEAGITSQEELTEANIDSKDALLEMCDDYLEQTKELDDQYANLYDILNIETKTDQGTYADSIQNYINDLIGGIGNMEVSDIRKNYGEEGIEALQYYIDDMMNYLGSQEELSKDEQKLYDNLYKITGGNSASELSDKELNKAINKLDKSNSTTNNVLKSVYSDQSILDDYTRRNEAFLAQLGLGRYYAQDYETATEALMNFFAITDAKDYKTAQTYWDTAKLAMNWNSLDSINNIDLAEQIGNHLDELGLSFAEGLDYVPYDNFVANLHEGEAVLTADTASELRNLTTTYERYMEQSVNFDTIIQTQTETLCAKLDEVVESIDNISTETTTTTTRSTTLSRMLSMRNTKLLGSTD